MKSRFVKQEFMHDFSTFCLIKYKNDFIIQKFFVTYKSKTIIANIQNFKWIEMFLGYLKCTKLHNVFLLEPN